MKSEKCKTGNSKCKAKNAKQGTEFDSSTPRCFFSLCVLHFAFPLALSRPDVFKALRWADRDSGFEKMVVVVLSAAAIAGLIYIASRLVRYFLKAVRVADSSRGLFEDLAHQHGLTPNEEKFLKGLAARIGMRSPATLFVRKSLMERELKKHSNAALRALLRKLFG